MDIVIKNIERFTEEDAVNMVKSIMKYLGLTEDNREKIDSNKVFEKEKGQIERLSKMLNLPPEIIDAAYYPIYHACYGEYKNQKCDNEIDVCEILERLKYDKKSEDRSESSKKEDVLKPTISDDVSRDSDIESVPESIYIKEADMKVLNRIRKVFLSSYELREFKNFLNAESIVLFPFSVDTISRILINKKTFNRGEYYTPISISNELLSMLFSKDIPFLAIRSLNDRCPINELIYYSIPLDFSKKDKESTKQYLSDVFNGHEDSVLKSVFHFIKTYLEYIPADAFNTRKWEVFSYFFLN